MEEFSGAEKGNSNLCCRANVTVPHLRQDDSLRVAEAMAEVTRLGSFVQGFKSFPMIWIPIRYCGFLIMKTQLKISPAWCLECGIVEHGQVAKPGTWVIVFLWL